MKNTILSITRTNLLMNVVYVVYNNFENNYLVRYGYGIY